MSSPDPAVALRRALLLWGLGHIGVGRTTTGWLLLVAEVLAIVGVAWLTIGLADTSAHMVAYLTGVAFITAWAWQAVDAYRSAVKRRSQDIEATARSAAAAIGWLCLPLLAWGAGFWLLGTHAGTPAGVIDRFVTAWGRDDLDDTWPAEVSGPADEAAGLLGSGPGRFHDVRFRIVSVGDGRALATGESIHFERRDTRLFGIFPGSELVPVADRAVLELELRATPVPLPGGGDIGAVRWELVKASLP
ncbi:MAG: hypothetical protein IT341_05515 [Chloroflexi bacterium]|nr:hypothetical protein [Chloroflexota bacterium]